MRKPALCICENKGAEQLCGSSAAYQGLCFHYIDSTFPLLPKSKISSLAIICVCTARFVLDLYGHAKDRFSRDKAQLAYTP